MWLTIQNRSLTEKLCVGLFKTHVQSSFTERRFCRVHQSSLLKEQCHKVLWSVDGQLTCLQDKPKRDRTGDHGWGRMMLPGTAWMCGAPVSAAEGVVGHEVCREASASSRSSVSLPCRCLREESTVFVKLHCPAGVSRKFRSQILFVLVSMTALCENYSGDTGNAR